MALDGGRKGGMRIALYQPDIPPNLGTILRLGACLGVAVDVIEPCGFALTDHGLRRAALDYLIQADWVRHDSWTAYLGARGPGAGRLVLLTTRATQPYTAFRFRRDDVLLFGRERQGVPESVQRAADARLRIPLRPRLRSLNVAVACAMVVGEALRQTRQFPTPPEGARG